MKANNIFKKEISLKSIARFWLISILLFLPFQLRIIQDNTLSSKFSIFLQYLDELTIVIFLPLAIQELFRRKIKPDFFCLLPVYMIAVFSAAGFISGIVNANKILITVLGTFDYLKNFLVIFIYAAFFTDQKDFNKIWHLVFAIGIFLGLVAFTQEIWSLTARYILGRSIYERGVYFLGVASMAIEDCWRLGLYRAAALTCHPNSLGLYSLLILAVYLFKEKKINFWIFFAFFSGVFFSVSRINYLGFVFLCALQILKTGRRWIAACIIPVIILLIFMSRMPDLKEKGETDFRTYTKQKALETWKDNLLLGAGPGMFGGVISITFHSPLYKKYGFSQHWYDYMQSLKCLDQFWPQALAETGIIGSAIFSGLLISLFLLFLTAHKRVQNAEIKGLFSALIVGVVFIFIYSLGYSLNATLFLFTFSAFAGVVLGNYESSNYK